MRVMSLSMRLGPAGHELRLMSLRGMVKAPWCGLGAWHVLWQQPKLAIFEGIRRTWLLTAMSLKLA